jgi:hypothetical protein
MMYAIARKIPVMLEFRSMDAPVEIMVPFDVLHYLDVNAERMIAQDGSVIYRMSDPSRLGAVLHENRARSLAVA